MTGATANEPKPSLPPRKRPFYTGLSFSVLAGVAIAIVLGPLNVLRAHPTPVHIALRLDVGISAGFLALFHTILILQVHLGGYLARAHDPPPANKVMWRGWSRLADIKLGAEIAATLATRRVLHGDAVAVMAPAFPATGRTTSGGHQLLHGRCDVGPF